MPDLEEEVYDRPHMVVDFNVGVKITSVRINSNDGIQHPVSVAFKYTLSGTSTDTDLMSVDNSYIFYGLTGDKIRLPEDTPFVARLNVYIVKGDDVASNLGYTVSFDGCEEASE